MNNLSLHYLKQILTNNYQACCPELIRSQQIVCRNPSTHWCKLEYCLELVNIYLYIFAPLSFFVFFEKTHTYIYTYTFCFIFLGRLHTHLVERFRKKTGFIIIVNCPQTREASSITNVAVCFKSSNSISEYAITNRIKFE